MRYYHDGHGCIVLLSDRVVVQLSIGSLDEMIRKAKDDASGVAGGMPAFTPYTMDDGCGLMHMTQGNIFAFRSSRILTGDRGDLDRALGSDLTL